MKTKLKHFDPKDWKLFFSILLTIAMLLVCVGIADSLSHEKYLSILNDPSGISDAVVLGFSMANFVWVFFFFLYRLWKTLSIIVPLIKNKWRKK